MDSYEWNKMEELYDAALESLGYDDQKKKPNFGAQMVKASLQGAALGLIPVVGIGLAAARGAQEGAAYNIKYLKWSLTEDIDRHESEIVNAINKVRKTVDVQPFYSNEVSCDKELITSLFRSGAKTVLHTDRVVITIPVIPEKLNTKLNENSRQAIKELQRIVNGIQFTETKARFKTLGVKAKYNSQRRCIEVLLLKWTG